MSSYEASSPGPFRDFSGQPEMIGRSPVEVKMQYSQALTAFRALLANRRGVSLEELHEMPLSSVSELEDRSVSPE